MTLLDAEQARLSTKKDGRSREATQKKAKPIKARDAAKGALQNKEDELREIFEEADTLISSYPNWQSSSMQLDVDMSTFPNSRCVHISLFCFDFHCPATLCIPMLLNYAYQQTCGSDSHQGLYIDNEVICIRW